ncbi:CDP-glycerol glycerophosphotransferase [Melghiribacillus thermohalophilus]|uniref:CDP-glycerol glycerophosphotransferase n=1 Tax=Melghiribacillus thermohalophilus TaxID=1324956 RepID=A0A4R3MUR9_9BACI|nr:CDP-glycerol glycerophosphotransferase family protein [Melghiribacillus thermohalophilus]TCT19885.1 CDP-glycerol glycerophosphotransferase [Melghiribacillus thermohalophilus]
MINYLKKMMFRAIRSKTAKIIYKKIFHIISFLPKKKNVIVFESFHGKQYSDSPRAIYEYMKKYEPSCKLIWSVDRRYTGLFRKLGIPYIIRFTPKWFWTMPRSKYWVNNVRIPNWMPKPKDTVFVQTWHGTPLKRLGLDIEEIKMPGTNTERYKKNFSRQTKKWDYLVSPNDYSSKIFKKAFDYSGNIIETGYPRNDYLYTFTEENVRNIKKRLNIPLDKKVILYAPTWRDNHYYSVGRYRFNLSLDLKFMREKLGDDFVVLLRMHYLIAENLDVIEYEGFAYDVSNYLDIKDLYIISDILITDYSSVFFDYANLRRPIIFYVYDLEEYRDQLRGFYFDLQKNAPGPLTTTTREVVEEINKFFNNGFQVDENFNNFYNKFCYLEDGNASKRVVDKFYRD